MCINNFSRYDDIINLNRPASNRPKMTPGNRAAQFAPFAALTGYGDAVSETARLVDSRPEIDEDRKAEIDRVLKYVKDNIEKNPEITVSFFKEDLKKEGGSVNSYTGHVKKIDSVNGLIFFEEGTSLYLSDLVSVINTDFSGFTFISHH